MGDEATRRSGAIVRGLRQTAFLWRLEEVLFHLYSAAVEAEG